MSKRRGSARGTGPVRPERVEAKGGADWYVRPLTGAASTKAYRCPGCDHLIPMATPHVVVWPVQKSLLSASAIDERRHWHVSCWRRKV